MPYGRIMVDGGGASAGRPAIQKAAVARTAYRNPSSPLYNNKAALGKAVGLRPADVAKTEVSFNQDTGRTQLGEYIPPAAPPPPTFRQTGSGRQASLGGGGGTTALAPSVFATPASITAEPAAIQPPAVVADAPPSAVNVPGESFSTVGTPGSFGQYDRLRQSRGPLSGMSVTPEMIRRAAAARLG